MLWIKAFHIIFMVCWFAGLFYLPRLFVYHAMAKDQISIERFKIMERKLYYGITTPSAIFTLIFGIWLILYNINYYLRAGWMHWKLLLVLLLFIYHAYCWKHLRDLKYDRNKHSHVYFRWFNEIPVIFLVAIILLVVIKP